MTLILQEIHCLTSKLLVFSYINWLLLTGTVSDPEARTRVTHMRFRQEGPKVHIYYDLEGDGMYLVTLAASEDGGQTFPITPKTVSGDVGDGVEPGRDKHIVWEAVKDVKGLRTDGLVFQVTAWTVTRPVLALGDTTLSFKEVTVGEEHTQILEIGNRGKAALRVWDIQVEGEKFQLVSEPELEVAPGGKGEVMVKFIPLDVGEYEGKLVFQTNDKQHPMEKVILRGIVLTDQGTVPRPKLALLGEDTMFDFGEVPVGEERTRALWIKNQGDAVLRVQGVQVSEGFYVEGELEWEVAPGKAKGTKVTFAPSKEGAYEGTLILQTNDKLHHPEGVILKLRGSGKAQVVKPPKEPVRVLEREIPAEAMREGVPKLEVVLRRRFWWDQVLEKGEKINFSSPQGRTARSVLLVRNVGGGVLKVELSLEAPTNDHKVFEVDPEVVRVPAGEERQVEVRYTPHSSGIRSSLLWLRSQGEDRYMTIRSITPEERGLIDGIIAGNVSVLELLTVGVAFILAVAAGVFIANAI